MKTRIVSVLLALVSSAVAQEGENAAAQANNPLANTTALNFQNYYIGEFTGLNEDANQFILRYAQPFTIGESLWLMRASLPLNTYPSGTGHTTGLGDFNIFAAYLFDTGNPAISVGLGPQLTVPSATDSAVGSEQWSAGFAHVLFNATSPKFQYGYLLTWQASFAGENSRDDVNLGAFQPFAFYQLAHGWYLRSAPVMVYDFDSGDYSIPLGLGIGKVFKTNSAVINAFVEPQYSVIDEGTGFPEWQVFTGVNFQF